MLTSKQRAELRSLCNPLPTTLMIGKEGVTENVAQSALQQLQARELVKARVLENALMEAREAAEQLCEMTGAEIVQVIGFTFVVYRKSEKLAQEAAAKRRAELNKKKNPVRKGAQERRRKQRQQREQRNAYFKQAAIAADIERRKQRNQ